MNRIMKKERIREGEILKFGDVIKGRYKVAEKLGHGSFGDVYAGIDTFDVKEVAIKIESGKKNCKQVFEVEMNVMRALQKSPYVVKLHDTGKVKGSLFFVMERLGPDLSLLRKSQHRRCFSLFTTLHLGIQMINIVESIHLLGLIHRDIKPSNFCIGRREGQTKKVFLIDFSLARRYRYHTGKIRSPRRKVGFRGTSRFASVNSHRGLDLYPRDDLWSVWYTMLEMFLGKLPWEGMKDRKQVGLLKTRFHLNDSYKSVPDEFEKIRRYLFSLSYKKLPDYDYLRNILVSLFHRRSYIMNLPLDWESQQRESSGRPGSFSEKSSPSKLRRYESVGGMSPAQSVVTCGSSTFSIGGESVKSFHSTNSNESISLKGGEKGRTSSLRGVRNRASSYRPQSFEYLSGGRRRKSFEIQQRQRIKRSGGVNVPRAALEKKNNSDFEIRRKSSSSRVRRRSSNPSGPVVRYGANRLLHDNQQQFLQPPQLSPASRQIPLGDPFLNPPSRLPMGRRFSSEEEILKRSSSLPLENSGRGVTSILTKNNRVHPMVIMEESSSPSSNTKSSDKSSGSAEIEVFKNKKEEVEVEVEEEEEDEEEEEEEEEWEKKKNEKKKNGNGIEESEKFELESEDNDDDDFQKKVDSLVKEGERKNLESKRSKRKKSGLCVSCSIL